MRVCRAGAAVCVVALLASGCFQSSTLIKIKPDGSGTIEQTTTMNADALAQLQAMAAMGDDKNKKAPGDIFSDAEARSTASKMGQGVTFVSSQKIDTPEHKGLKAIYSFSDIRKISLEEMSTPGGMASDSQGGPAPQKDPPLTFKFSQLPDGHAVLTIMQNGVANGMASPGASGAKTGQTDPKAAAQGIEMMKMFMKGLKVDLAVQVDRLIKTNSAYVSGGTVTVLGMDFDKVLADPAALDRLNNAKSLSDSKLLLKDVKGLKVNVQPEVTIEFAGR